MSTPPTMIVLVEEYLAYRRRLGYDLRGIDNQLRRFAQYADAIGYRGPVTVELAVRWARLPQQASPHWWQRRLGFVRGFAKFCSVFDPGTEIPPAGQLGPSCPRCTPHIYSAAEICALLSAASELGPSGGLRPHTYVALFGLLVSSGLRISEALRLRRADVDLQAGVLAVQQSKFRKSRLVPVHLSSTMALRRYVELRDRYHLQPADAFFLNERGAPLGKSGVAKTFGILRRGLGWKAGPTGRRPRIHDLRHYPDLRIIPN